MRITNLLLATLLFTTTTAAGPIAQRDTAPDADAGLTANNARALSPAEAVAQSNAQTGSNKSKPKHHRDVIRLEVYGNAKYVDRPSCPGRLVDGGVISGGQVYWALNYAPHLRGGTYCLVVYNLVRTPLQLMAELYSLNCTQGEQFREAYVSGNWDDYAGAVMISDMAQHCCPTVIAGTWQDQFYSGPFHCQGT